MTQITVYYNPTCIQCRRRSEIAQKLDWFHRLTVSTDMPPSGPLEPGKIAVQDQVTGQIYLESEAIRKLCLAIPAYFLYGVFLSMPGVRKSSKVACHDQHQCANE